MGFSVRLVEARDPVTSQRLPKETPARRMGMPCKPDWARRRQAAPTQTLLRRLNPRTPQVFVFDYEIVRSRLATHLVTKLPVHRSFRFYIGL